MKKLFLLLFLCLFYTKGFGQTCNGPIILSDQTRVNNFKLDYSGCTEIIGNLTINGSGITNLDSLNHLKSVSGVLTISSSSIISLPGLNSLKSVGGLTIGSNQQLTSISGLNALENVNGNLRITQHNALLSISGFNALKNVNGNFQLGGPVLETNTGFNSLENITRFTILNNKVTNLNNFSSLKNVVGELIIQNNTLLSDISALETLNPATLTDLIITGNTNLSVCSLPNFCTYLSDSGAQIIDSNNTGCATEQEILDNCITCLEPENLGTTNLADQTATLVWESDGESFEVEWGAFGFTQGSGTTFEDITTNSYNLTGLSPETQYQFYVRQICGPYHNSYWEGPYSFTTKMACPTGNLSFNNQASIDDFGQNYSHCTHHIGNISISNNINNLDGLNHLESITGLLSISSTNIQQISGLNSLKSISNYLSIQFNSQLNDISGFNELENVNGNMNIDYNNALTNISGFTSLKGIGNNLTFQSNSELTGISGFNALENVNGDVSIEYNYALINLPDFDSLEHIAKNLKIQNNSALVDFSGFESLVSIGGNFDVSDNQLVQNFEGFNALESIGGYFNVRYSNIKNFTGLNSLTSIGGYFDLYNNEIQNFSGLNNLTSIGGYFKMGLLGSLTTLNGLNSLTHIGGNFSTQLTYGLQNIQALSSLQTVGGNFTMDGFSSVQNLQGLGSLTTIGGELQLTSTDIRNLNGLDALTSVKGLKFQYNSNLENLNPLNSLTSINGNIDIRNNSSSLTDISGLMNINPTTIQNLIIQNNYYLSICSIPNLCTYLSNPSNNSTISNNAQGCASKQEILDNCASGECPYSTIWDGFSWSNGAPNAAKKAIINGNLVVNSDLEACAIEVTENGNLVIQTDGVLTVNGSIVNLGSAENFIVESDANLIQINDVENSGEITVRRNSAPMMRLDYALWSSPVDGQGIHAFSPNTVASRIYTYEGEQGYQLVENLEAPFTAAKGYMFRAPNNWNQTTDANGGNPVAYPGEFVGVPFNGYISVDVHPMSFTSVGNPYPSNIFLGDDFSYSGQDTFLNANPNVMTIYFWTNTYGADGNGGYEGNNWATYTFMGGTSTGLQTSVEPSPYIAPGQGFIVSSYGEANQIHFNNSMRVSNQATFFKNDDNKHRFWLNLKGDNSESFNQILIGYMQGATQGIDHQIDGRMFAYNGPAIYSLIDEENFTIQGRPLPFETTDEVPLGFKTEVSGKYLISLSAFEGVFEEGVQIFIKDKDMNLTHNLMESDYEFESASGEFNERFFVVYEEEQILSNTDFESNNIQIYTNNEFIVVESKKEKILSVELYDMSGRNLFKQEKVNAHEFRIKSDRLETQILVVKVQTQNGEIVSKKIINK